MPRYPYVAMPPHTMSRRQFVCLGASCLLPSLSHAADSLQIVYPRAESQTDERSLYPLQLLQLALNKSGVAFHLQPSNTQMPQNSAMLQLASGQDITVVWSMTSKQREQDLLAIRIPLDKGLLGWRLLLIRQKDQDKFNRIKQAADLQKLSAVQGHDWPDTDILRANGFRVEGNPHYEFLFTMLEKGVVDYFPRSVLEIWDEEKKHPNMGLAIEQNLILQYPTAMYFFVRKNNTALATLLENGLQTALKDGSFDQLFMRFYSDIMQRANLKGRTRISLHNPLLPAATPLQQKELWLNFS
ncbi:MAG: transporter substrate-binding domain-containing protein [Burkholderiales bacterium]|nr:transporter substrate-binding domain-containing protein [Burkholderiales bacterium]